ncbi:hypothetical protein CCACVL1_27786, partial [Corchorus capsularis]
TRKRLARADEELAAGAKTQNTLKF